MDCATIDSTRKGKDVRGVVRDKVMYTYHFSYCSL